MLQPQPAGATLVVFKPMGPKETRPSIRGLGTADRGRSEVILFPPRGRAGLAKPPTGEPASIGDERPSAPGDPDWHLTLFEDLLGLAWVAASLTAGYYMLTALSKIS
jgi:hypothetical protein